MIQIGTRREDRSELWLAVLAVYVVALFFTKYVDYVYSSGILPIPPSIPRYGLYVAVFVTAAFNSERTIRLLRNPVFWWGMAFVAITFLWVFGTAYHHDVQVLLRDRLHAMAFLFCCLFILDSDLALRTARWALVFAVLLAFAMNVWDALVPLRFSPIYGRSAGFYGNPNQAGIAMVLGMVLGIRVLPNYLRPFFYLLVVAGVAMTFSRSAFLSVVIAGAGLLIMRQLTSRQVAAISLLLFVSGALYLSTFESWDAFLRDSNFLNENTRTRAEFSTDDNSAQTRKALAAAALRMYKESPIWGSGLGASIVWGHEASSHNVYLNLMVDHGLIGFFLVPLLLAAVWRRNRDAVLLVLVIFWWGFYSHNVIYERFILFCLALQAMESYRRMTVPRLTLVPAFLVETYAEK